MEYKRTTDVNFSISSIIFLTTHVVGEFINSFELDVDTCTVNLTVSPLNKRLL